MEIKYSSQRYHIASDVFSRGDIITDRFGSKRLVVNVFFQVGNIDIRFAVVSKNRFIRFFQKKWILLNNKRSKLSKPKPTNRIKEVNNPK